MGGGDTAQKNGNTAKPLQEKTDTEKSKDGKTQMKRESERPGE